MQTINALAYRHVIITVHFVCQYYETFAKSDTLHQRKGNVVTKESQYALLSLLHQLPSEIGNEKHESNSDGKESPG
jgi:hypothetical protein